VLKDYENADIIISTGGTYLVENYNLESRIIDFLIAIILNKNLVLFTQSLGPFVKQDNIDVFKFIFWKSKFIFLRDTLSKENLSNIVAEQEKIFLFADAAFALADVSHIHKIAKEYTLPARLNVAISVRYWPHFKEVSPQSGQNNYLNSMKELSTFLVRNMGCKVTYISTCQGIPEYYLDDSEVAVSIYNGLPSDVQSSITVDRNHYSPEELLEILKIFDFTIATRLHMAILSMCVGVPAIPIAYEFKSIELFEKIGLGNWVANIENLNSEQLISLVLDFKHQLLNIKQKVAVEVEKEFLNAMASGAILQSLKQ
jgi:colanic acid/amylovoran biosynthesis protein